MVLAVSLHVWGVDSPEPQEPVYAVLASRLVDAVLGNPPLPLAPPLPLGGARSTAASRVIIETKLLNVPPVPGPPVSSPAAADARLVPAGTSGTMFPLAARAADSVDVAPHPGPAGPPVPPVDDGVVPEASAEPSPPAMVATTVPPLDVRADPAAPSPDKGAPSANRIALPADRKETDPGDAPDDQRRQVEVVLAVLREYTRALERFDVGATKAIYPSVDDRRLRQSFEDVETARYEFGKCGVSFSPAGDGANAWCIGKSTFRPKIGSRVIKYSDQAWQFTLARDGGAWQIREARFQ